MPIETGKEILVMINDIMTKAKDFDKNTFMAMTCMLVEEWCKQNKEDVIEYHEDCLNAAKAVTAFLGGY